MLDIKMKRKFFDIVVAACKTSEGKFGIGNKNSLPWNSKIEMGLFKTITKDSVFKHNNGKNIVIMGRKTFESIPKKFRPLNGRINIVISKSFFNNNCHSYKWEGRNVCYFNDFNYCLDYLNQNSVEEELNGNIFVIGGGELYNQAINNENLRYIYLSQFNNQFNCDTFFNFQENNFNKLYESNKCTDNQLNFNWNIYSTKPYTDNITNFINPSIMKIFNTETITEPIVYEKNSNHTSHPENQYLHLLRDILDNGIKKPDRTGTGIFSVFGRQLHFNNVGDFFPLLTTKKVFWKGVSIELLWFLSGCTNAKILADKGVHIWDGNTSRDF
jgi:dihydrofolate reductase / thymidylate synthase